MSVLMPLSWLARVGSLCFNLLLTFPSVVRILSSQVISFQTLCYAPFPRFPWSSLLPFPSYFKLHNLLYLRVDISKDDTTRPPKRALNYQILDLHSNTHPIPKNVSQHPIDQSHPTYHPDNTTLHYLQPHLIHNGKFLCFTTVQQNWSNTTLIKFPLMLQR